MLNTFNLSNCADFKNIISENLWIQVELPCYQLNYDLSGPIRVYIFLQEKACI